MGMNKTHRKFFLIGFSLFTLSTSAFSNPRIEHGLVLPDLPPLSELEHAALTRAGMDPSVIGRWQRKSRLAPALPSLQVGYEQKALQQNTTVVQDSISVTSAGVAIGPESNRLDQDFNNNRGFEVKAVWALDELMFNRDELEVSREARDLTVFRERLSEELIRTYFDLKQELLAMRSDPCIANDPVERLHAEQLIEKTDSLTGGEFKKLWQGYGAFQESSTLSRLSQANKVSQICKTSEGPDAKAKP